MAIRLGKVEIPQAFWFDPADFVMVMALDLPGEQSGPEGHQLDGKPGRLERDGAQKFLRFDLDAHLFTELPLQAFLRAFARLDLSPRKLPSAFESIALFPPGNEDLAAAIDDGRGYLDRKPTGSFRLRSIVHVLNIIGLPSS